MKIIFFGHDAVSLEVLKIIQQNGELSAIVVPANRSKLQVKPLIDFAKKAKIRFYQPKSPNSRNFVKIIRRLKPDLAIVYNYSRIFKKEIIDVFPKGMINFHGALLPQYQGANVINWVLINGEKQSGVTAHYINEKIDDGPIIKQIKFPIKGTDTVWDLKQKIGQLTPKIAKEVLQTLSKTGKLEKKAQHGRAQYYPRRKPQDGQIDFTKPAQDVHNLIRALASPWPGAFTFIKNRKIVLEKSKLLKDRRSFRPGEILEISREGLVIGAGKGKILISQIRRGNKMVIPNKGFTVGDIFTDRNKVVCIHQPNFMPWLGLFEKISRSDIFVVFDTSKIGKNSVINRNLIKTPQGPSWLTVPVHASLTQEFREIKIDNSINWREKHLKSLFYNYKKAPNFDLIYPKIEKVYRKKYRKLIDLNLALLAIFLKELDIKVKFVFASDLKGKGDRNETLISFIKKVGAKTYLAGNGSKAYVNESLFAQEGIKVVWQNFQHPTYQQLWGEFIPNLSAVDYLMCDGRKDLFR